MATRKLLAGLFLLGVLLLAPAGGAQAGGWAVATLDRLPPTAVNAGEEVTLGFYIRSHGQEGADGLWPRLIATHAATGERLRVKADNDRRGGHYTATIIFPKAGAWNWQIDMEPYPQTLALPPIEVGNAPFAAPATPPAANGALFFRVAALVVLGLAGLSLLGERRRAAGALQPGAAD